MLPPAGGSFSQLAFSTGAGLTAAAGGGESTDEGVEALLVADLPFPEDGPSAGGRGDFAPPFPGDCFPEEGVAVDEAGADFGAPFAAAGDLEPAIGVLLGDLPPGLGLFGLAAAGVPSGLPEAGVGDFAPAGGPCLDPVDFGDFEPATGVDIFPFCFCSQNGMILSSKIYQDQ